MSRVSSLNIFFAVWDRTPEQVAQALGASLMPDLFDEATVRSGVVPAVGPALGGWTVLLASAPPEDPVNPGD